MNKHGKRIVAAMEEVLAYAEGRPSKVKLHNLAPSEIRDARMALNMTQAEFAAAFHCSLPTLRKWEQGQREPIGPAMVLLSNIRRAPNAVRRAMRQVEAAG